MRRAATDALVGVAVALLGLSLGPSASAAAAHGRTPIATTSYFVFYSDFETNLNDALINAGVARRFHRPEPFRAGDEAACFAKLEPAVRAGWNRALDYYAEIVSPAGFNDRGQLLIRLQIAGFDDERLDSKDQELVDIARSLRGAAAPAYRACRWTAQNDANRRWVAAALPALTAHERAVGERLGRLYEKTWRGLPLPVDVVQTVDWSGANTIFLDPVGGHILIAIENDPKSALEVVFHEASHLFMRHGDPLRQALETAAEAARWQLPADLWHVVLFYTTGEAVRGILAAGGEPGYRPMLYGIYDRGTWVAYREPIETAWAPYVQGKRTLSAAAADLIDLLRRRAGAAGRGAPRARGGVALSGLGPVRSPGHGAGTAAHSTW